MQILNNQLTSRNLSNAVNILKNDKKLRVNAVRTLPIEYLISFLSKLNTNLSYKYSSYDTSLQEIDFDSDLYLFWMDWRLYMDKMEPQSLINWLKTRLIEIDASKPILINNWPIFWNIEEKQYAASVTKRNWMYEYNYLLEVLKDEYSNLEVIDLNLFASQIGIESYDARNDEVSNYPLSNKLTLQIARHITFQLIPAMTEPKLKAIVVDLDNTLYNGVLGEDGFDGIVLTEEHVQLQQALKNLKKNGILLAISSKNDERDVIHLLEQHPQFILRKEDFTFIEANWNSKAGNILSMSERFNFDVSAMLFIDDNPAEIAHVQTEIPSIKVLQADVTGTETVHRLLNYPYLYSRKKDALVELRQKDILANQRRQQLAKQSNDLNSYLKSLNMTITVYENEASHLNRVFEMGHKTNQFNLALNRFSEADVQERNHASNHLIFTVTLSDMLNDSGVIGVFFIKLDGELAFIEEVLFSCRALGRKVEDASLLIIIKKLASLGIKEVQIQHTEGPRNRPALDWLNNIYTSTHLTDIQLELNKRLVNYPGEVYWQNERNH